MTFAGLPFWGVAALVALSAAILGVLHLLRVQPREMRVVTTIFWAHAVERTRARRLLERFRHPLTYALLLLTCAFMALALGRPERTQGGAERLHTVVIVDAGSTMGAPDGSRRRIDSAREKVLELVGGLPADARVALIAAQPWPRLLHGFDDPRPLVGREVASLEPASAPAERGAAMALATSLLNGGGTGRMLLVTDRPLGQAEEETPAVTIIPVGTPLSNAAIIYAAFEPQGDAPLKGRLVVRVASHGATPQDVTVRVERAGGAPLLNSTQRLAPGTIRNFEVKDLTADGDRLRVRLEGDAGAPGDNTLALRLPLRAPIRTACPPEAPETLRLALQSDPAVRLVPPGAESDIQVLMAVGSDASAPSIVVHTSGPEVHAGQIVTARTGNSILRGIALEHARSGTGAGLANVAAGEALLIAGDSTLASYVSSPPRLNLGSALLGKDASISRTPAFAAIMSQAVRRLAGWSDDPVVLTPDRSWEDPLWTRRAGLAGEVVVLPTNRTAADLAAPVDSGAPGGGTRSSGASLAAFELLLLGAIAFFAAEVLLHARGRIP